MSDIPHAGDTTEIPPEQELSLEQRITNLESQHLTILSTLNRRSQDIDELVDWIRNAKQGTKVLYWLLQKGASCVIFLGKVAVAGAALWGVYIAWKDGHLSSFQPFGKE